MRCPNCGNEIYELLDYAIARCMNCYSLWDPYVYPGFPVPTVEPGEIWDTSEIDEDGLTEDENDDLEDSNISADEDEIWENEENNDEDAWTEDNNDDIDENDERWDTEEDDDQ